MAPADTAAGENFAKDMGASGRSVARRVGAARPNCHTSPPIVVSRVNNRFLLTAVGGGISYDPRIVQGPKK